MATTVPWPFRWRRPEKIYCDEMPQDNGILVVVGSCFKSDSHTLALSRSLSLCCLSDSHIRPMNHLDSVGAGAGFDWTGMRPSPAALCPSPPPSGTHAARTYAAYVGRTPCHAAGTIFSLFISRPAPLQRARHIVVPTWTRPCRRGVVRVTVTTRGPPCSRLAAPFGHRYAMLPSSVVLVFANSRPHAAFIHTFASA